MLKKDINSIFNIFMQDNPNPKTELNFSSPYECLIAVMLSAQTTDIQVNKVTKTLFIEANTPEKMIKLRPEEIIFHIKHIGLFRSKAKNVISTSQKLIDKFQGKVPNSLSELQSLPGVGRKTALVVMNAIFGASTIAVDTHVQRVAHRIGLVKDCKTPLATEKMLIQAIPQQYQYNAHHWLILHGRYICKARKPHCNNCIIAKYCQYFQRLNF